MRPKPLYYRTDNDMLSVWNCGNSGILWLWESNSITAAPHNGCAWLPERQGINPKKV
jgi:hypothetical protein